MRVAQSPAPAPGQHAQALPLLSSPPAWADHAPQRFWLPDAAARGRGVSRLRPSDVSLAGRGLAGGRRFQSQSRRAATGGKHPGSGGCGWTRMLPRLIPQLAALLSLLLGSRAHGKDRGLALPSPRPPRSLSYRSSLLH